MREIRTSGSTRGRRAADLICYSSSYSTGHSFFGWTGSHRQVAQQIHSRKRLTTGPGRFALEQAEDGESFSWRRLAA